MSGKKRKISYRDLGKPPEAEAEAEPVAEVRAEPEHQPQPQPEPEAAPPAAEPEIVVSSRLTPRQLAAVLNDPRRTPAAGIPAITELLQPQSQPQAQPHSPLAVAAALATQTVIEEEPAPDLTEVLLFRLGGERFAAALAAIEEAVDLPQVHTIPESPPELLGVFELRGRLIPLYSAARALRVPARLDAPASAFILSNGSSKLGIAVDALDDAITLPADALRDAPGGGAEEGDGVLLGIAHAPDGVVTIVSATALARTFLVDDVDSIDVGGKNTSAAPEAA